MTAPNDALTVRLMQGESEPNVEEKGLVRGFLLWWTVWLIIFVMKKKESVRGKSSERRNYRADNFLHDPQSGHEPNTKLMS